MKALSVAWSIICIGFSVYLSCLYFHGTYVIQQAVANDLESAHAAALLELERKHAEEAREGERRAREEAEEQERKAKAEVRHPLVFSSQ